LLFSANFSIQNLR